MTEPIPLPALLTAISQEARHLASEVRAVEEALLPTLLPVIAGRAEMGGALQRLDPLLQRLAALARVADQAATEAPPLPMPAATACLRDQRLAGLLRDVQPTATSPAAATIFDPLP